MLIAEQLVPRPEILAVGRTETGESALPGAVPDGDGPMVAASGLVKRHARAAAQDAAAFSQPAPAGRRDG